MDLISRLHQAVNTGDWSGIGNDELEMVARAPAAAPISTNEVVDDANIFHIDQKMSKRVPVQKAIGETNKMTDLISERIGMDLVAKDKADSAYDAKMKDMDEILGQIKGGPVKYEPSLDYDKVYSGLQKDYDNVEIRERNPIAQAIVSLGPALLGSITGESGAIAQLPATKRAEAMYDSQLKDSQIIGLKNKEVISKKMEATSKAKEQDVSKWKQTAELDKQNKDQIIGMVEKNTKLTADEKNALFDAINKNFALGIKTSADQIKEALGYEGKIQTADMNIKANAGYKDARLDEQKERFVNSAWNSQMKDVQGRLEGAGRVRGFIDQIKSGNMSDYKTARNTLTQDLAALMLPTGQRPSVAAANKMSVDTIQGLLADIENKFITNDGKLSATIPKPILDQLEKELSLVEDRYSHDAVSRVKGLSAGTNDKTKKDLFSGKLQELGSQHNFDPSTGKKISIEYTEPTVISGKKGEIPPIDKNDPGFIEFKKNKNKKK